MKILIEESVLRQALEALKYYAKSIPLYKPGTDAITALRTALDAAEKVEPVALIPDILFDGFTVLKCLTESASKRTSAENVSDVLDAVVRFMKANPAPAVPEDK